MNASASESVLESVMGFKDVLLARNVASFSLAVGALSVMWPFALGLWVQGLSQQMGHATQNPDPDAGVSPILHACPASTKLWFSDFYFKTARSFFF